MLIKSRQQLLLGSVVIASLGFVYGRRAYNWNNDKYSVFGEASAKGSLTYSKENHAVNGNLGLKMNW